MKNTILITMLLIIAGCTTIAPLDMTPTQIQKLTNEGELSLVDKNLIIVKNNNSELDVVVLSTTKNSLVTSQGEILYSDIREIKITKIDKGKTARNVGVGLAAGLAASMVAFLIVVGDL